MAPSSGRSLFCCCPLGGPNCQRPHAECLWSPTSADPRGCPWNKGIGVSTEAVPSALVVFTQRPLLSPKPQPCFLRMVDSERQPFTGEMTLVALGEGLSLTTQGDSD